MQASAWQQWEKLAQQIEEGKIIVLDGGTGTEIDRIAGSKALDAFGWCCVSQLVVPDIVEGCHSSYLAAGADIITTNTYATNRNILTSISLGNRVEEAIVRASEIAQSAVQKYAQVNPRHCLIAGSISHFHGYPRGTDFGSCVPEIYPAPDVEEAAYQEAAQLLSSNGVDMLFLESLRIQSHALRVIRAARSTGLPLVLAVAVRMSREEDKSGTRALFWGRMVEDESQWDPFTKESFLELVEAGGRDVAAVAVMHTPHDAVGPALRKIREWGWTGVLGAYAEEGKFVPPLWEFVRFSVEEAAAYWSSWRRDAAVGIIGGCCGIGPDYIAALRRFVDSRGLGVTVPPPPIEVQRRTITPAAEQQPLLVPEQEQEGEAQQTTATRQEQARNPSKQQPLPISTSPPATIVAAAEQPHLEVEEEEVNLKERSQRTPVEEEEPEEQRRG